MVYITSMTVWFPIDISYSPTALHGDSLVDFDGQTSRNYSNLRRSWIE